MYIWLFSAHSRSCVILTTHFRAFPSPHSHGQSLSIPSDPVPGDHWPAVSMPLPVLCIPCRWSCTVCGLCVRHLSLVGVSASSSGVRRICSYYAVIRIDQCRLAAQRVGALSVHQKGEGSIPVEVHIGGNQSMFLSPSIPLSLKPMGKKHILM